MEADEGPGLIDRLKDRLYKRGPYRSDASRSKFSQPRGDVPTAWQESESSDTTMLTPKFLKKLFIFSLTFFLLAVGAAVFIVGTGSNVVSSSNLEVTLQGPVAIKGGDELSLGILIDNNNSTPLENVDLLVTFPPGTREPGKLDKELVRFRKNIGTLSAGETSNETVRAILFAQSASDQEIKVTVEYRTAGSNAIFEKVKVYKVRISSSPVDVSLAIPNELSVGNEIELGLDVSTASSEGLQDLLAEVAYPSGFRFVSATPKPAFGNNVWAIGALAPGGTRHIVIIGVLDGQDNEKKLFRATAGLASADREDRVAVPYSSLESTVLLRRAFVDLASSINGSSGGESATDAGESLRGDVTVTNNLPDKILEGKVTVRFSGVALDQSSVLATNGAYRSIDNTITWTEQHEPDLAIVDSAGTAHLNWSFATLPLSRLSTKNPYVDLEIAFDGIREVNGAPGAAVRSTQKKRVKINSELGMAARAVHSVGPFVNSGPLPPRANVETTYTVMWSLTDTPNDLDGVVVKAILPSHSRYLGIVSPSVSALTYDATRGELTWNVGKLSAALSGSPVAEVAFQIALLPSVPQVGQSLPLVTNMSVSGRDVFTSTTLRDTVANIDMRIVSDPNYTDAWATVAP